MKKALSLFALTFAVAAPSAFADEKARLRLVSDKTHEQYLNFWPKSNDAWLNDLKKKDLTFYDDSAMPRAYQNWDGLLTGVHSPSYNISAVASEPFGSANREFPWGSPAGLHDSPNFKAIRFVSFPKGDAILWWRERLPRDGGMGSFVWQYRPGTIFGEILMVTDPQGYDFTFELRTRTRTEKGWTMNAFRPFTTHAELAKRIKQLDPKWKDNPALVKIVNGDSDDEKVLRITNNHDLITFDSTALSTKLPAIDHDLVRKLLETPFKSALGQEWKKGEDGTEAHAPSTDAAFHVVPKNFKGAFVAVTSESCMRCHDSTLKHARDFQGFRDWYGRVRGSDNIFSFHIFDPSSISYNGFSGEPRFRRELVDAGLLTHWR